jgi:CBS domain-containing protein
VALDDALALLLYRVAATGADALTGTGHSSMLAKAGVLFAEIFGALLLGFLVGVVLYYILRLVRDDDKILVFSLSSLLLIVGISMIKDIGPILPAMVFGVTIANIAPRAGKSVFGAVEKFSPPVYVSFFVLAGAHLEFDRMEGWMLGMIAVYLLCRVVGKVAGCWFGGRYSHAPETVRKYLGICLLPQAGVAIGLAILASRQFNSETGHTIVMVVMMATFVMEILGPMLVKVGVKKAGEVGMNITEEDLIKTYSVGQVMDTKVPNIEAGMSLSEVIKVVSSTDNFYYSVVGRDKELIGAITLDGIRNTFTIQELNDWLVALDIVEPVILKVTPDIALADAFEKAQRLDIEYIPVTASGEDDTFVGLLDCRSVHRALAAEVLERQRKADSIGISGQKNM